MAKRLTEQRMVRGVVSVSSVPAVEVKPWSRPSFDIVVREEGNRRLRLRITRKNARQLGVLLDAALS